MSGVLTICGDKRSGNCLKVLWTAERVGRSYAWVDVDVMKAETRTEAFLRMNPAGQVPTVILEDGRSLAQSNAIILHLAEGTDLIPADAFDRAKMFEWMFWEQYSHEPCIAVRRFRKTYMRLPDDEIDPDLLPRGRRVLGVMENHLLARDWFAGDRLSLADIALVAYTRVAHEGGFDLGEFPQVAHWVGRVEDALSLPAAREAA